MSSRRGTLHHCLPLKHTFQSAHGVISLSYQNLSFPVYPTTSSYLTSRNTATKLTPIITATSSARSSRTIFYIDIKSTLSNVFASTPAVISSIEYTSLGTSTGQGSLYAIIGAVLALVFVLIAVLLILKRRDARPTSDSTTYAGNSEKNQENGYFTTVATERTIVKSLSHEYEEVNETQKDMSGVYYSRGIVSKNWGSSRPQNKHLKFDTGTKLGEGLYENNATNAHNKTVDDQDYSHAIYRIQQASLKVAYVNK
ncbi:hypothetical protein HOLleu_25454 [Holothuria leucospilota]|uniref:Uncharacterized protein n=1 Tax=Holothuria leucospilota TaxID=206669 RepID=A0A9Q1BT18_HOLLE|nr:hypothetical protein HOLleu_25454 [Holothuria leucospilota]